MGISCPDAGHCLAVDNNGDALVSTDPSGGPGSWVKQNLIPYAGTDEHGQAIAPNAIFGASCPTTSLCVLAATGRRILTSTDPFEELAAGGGGQGKRRGPPKRPRTILAHVDRVHIFTRHRSLKMTFRFYTRTRSRGFRCRFDSRAWRRCASPVRLHAGLGHHAFRVRAIGPTGLEGPVAGVHFRVVSNKKRQASKSLCPGSPKSALEPRRRDVRTTRPASARVRFRGRGCGRRSR
jgi:hypothetical protein